MSNQSELEAEAGFTSDVEYIDGTAYVKLDAVDRHIHQLKRRIAWLEGKVEGLMRYDW